MKTLRNVLIIFVVLIALLPIGDYVDDTVFNYSHIKRAIESVDNYDDQFVDDVSKLGLYGEILTHLVSDSAFTYLFYASEEQFDNRDRSVVSSSGYVSLIVIYETSDGYEEVFFPTPINVNTDSYDDYVDYYERTLLPINRFVEAYNVYLEVDNVLLEIIAIIGIIAGGIFGIFFLLFVFLFDSITMVWGLILCLLRLIGLVPVPI